MHSRDDKDDTIHREISSGVDTNTITLAGAKVGHASRLETVNGLYIPTKVKSRGSLLRKHGNDTSRTAVTGSNIVCAPNPSYNCGLSPSHTENNSNDYYYCMQADDESSDYDDVMVCDTTGRVHDEVADPSNNVKI